MMVMTAILMLGLLLAVGVAIDSSRIYMVRAELQNAADAAALAGSRELNAGTTGIVSARDRAISIANTYSLNNAAITVDGNTGVEFAVNLNAPDGNGRTYVNYQTFSGWSAAAKTAFAAKVRFVRVTTQSASIGILFSRSVLGASHSEARSATAGLYPNANVICDTVPFSVYDNVGAPFTPGGLYTIRLDPGNAVSPGNYLILDLPGCSGDCTREQSAGGTGNCVSALQSLQIDTEPGTKAGQVRQGINARFGDYGGGLDPQTYPPDENVAEGINYDAYSNGTTTQLPQSQYQPYMKPGRRVVFLPIFITPPGSGSSQITVDRWGRFFIRSKVPGGNGGEIQLEYIDDKVQAAQAYYDCTKAGGGISVTSLYK